MVDIFPRRVLLAEIKAHFLPTSIDPMSIAANCKFYQTFRTTWEAYARPRHYPIDVYTTAVINICVAVWSYIYIYIIYIYNIYLCLSNIIILLLLWVPYGTCLSWYAG